MVSFKKLKNLFSYKKPIIKENTFLLWEPCSHSHAEIVPGFTKYLLDLGYHVSILINPKRFEEGLFCRFDNQNISYNKLSKKQIYKYFKRDSLENVEGVLITTIGKLYDGKNLNQAYDFFDKQVNKHKLFFVEHEIDSYINNNSNPRKDIITLRNMDYKNAITVPVNPHYFGKVNLSGKNKLTKFITIGALSEKRKSTKLLINVAKQLLDKGITNFKITVIGKGNIKDLPPQLQSFFDIKGRLDFDQMYNEIENADFILSAYEDNPEHRKYITSKTSGTFQLVYGFLKPIIIREDFAPINGFNSTNAILYSQDSQYSDAMIKAINMPAQEYRQTQLNLEKYINELYLNSKINLQKLIKGYTTNE
ncbi:MULTISPECIES: hypothetical protein [Francisella]|uniref:Glycosyl transferase family 1 domain-containing protein n=1 Tax=Francisella opportunistica TaxID=2016517 RepID=A0A345JQJ6_9GAMM|nr:MULTISPECIES: hypothetical protein [Francisella]APC91297.1 hypothetical protein BBG19_0561 [Francisella sp. MA067296]AXH29592.1 hypothetical protein CGC43_02860 [Francisella opportunistica]AXH31243.1 hypothetical protein CGC44_02835 [Francisella opportunistica]AXH32890.1 hypothetical protein CGC45_02845 [Francisella opportunistica]